MGVIAIILAVSRLSSQS